MGILNLIVNALCAGGIRAQRAYPGGRMAAITGPSAAVQLQSMDSEAKKAAVLVSVLVPATAGAGNCEDTAVNVSRILQESGGDCMVGKCRYIASAELFCAEVTAVFLGTEAEGVWTPWEEPAAPVFTVTVGGVLRKYAVSFTAQRAVDETAITIADAQWLFSLEEEYPLDSTEEVSPTEPFTIVVVRKGRTETYTGCVVTGQKRILTGDSQRHIRSGTAGSMTIS